MGTGHKPHLENVARTESCSALDFDCADKLAPTPSRALRGPPPRVAQSYRSPDRRPSRTPGRRAPQISEYLVTLDLPLDVPITADELRALEILLGQDLMRALATSEQKVA
jgi:hypothetical protein